MEEPSQLHPGPRQLLKELLRERRGVKVRAGESQAGVDGVQLGARARVAMVPTCDLWRLHHCFLEEGFCLCKWEESLWCSTQTLVPSGSLWGEAVLLVCWERLQAIYQGPWHLFAWQAVDVGVQG